MKWVFYGGAFDPLTIAHEKIIRDLYDNFRNRLIVGVTNHDYKKSWKPIDWRMSCVNEYCEGLCWSCFDEIKVVEQDCRTFEFLSKLKVDIGMIAIGMDEWDDLKAGKWYNADKLLSKYSFLVIPRTSDVSSTKVRELAMKEERDEIELLKYVSVPVLGKL